MRLAGVVVLLVFTASWTPAAVFSFYSSFNTGTEGWTISGGGTGPVHVPAGGVGNTGYIEVTDTANGFLYYLAPASWSGNLYGGTLSFYLRNANPENYGSGPQPIVMVQSGSTTLYALSGYGLPGLSGTGWTLNSFVLDSTYGGWSTTELSLTPPSPVLLMTVLSNVSQIGILGDWVFRFGTHPLGCPLPGGDCTDITGLDEVRLYSSEVVIPEPGSFTLLGLGLGAGLLFVRRRSR